MTRKEEILKELDLAIKRIRVFGERKIAKYSEEDLIREAHLLGIDIVHDACHTLRGRLPKTDKVDLAKMRDSWEADSE